MLDARVEGPPDMIVIGGGITGCGIARDAVLRGLRVALLEKNDFASGTSSRSSRLVHGGIRYLEHGYLHLVFEAATERERLIALAPGLVRPLEFTWPVYRGARIPMWKLAIGLTIYDALARRRPGRMWKHHRTSAEGVLTRQPGLRADGLKGGAVYIDAETDDARLTAAVAMDARQRGAQLYTHTVVESLVMENGRAVGVGARDVLTGNRMALRAPMIINAAGPWSDSIRQLEGHAARPRVQGSKGVHISVPEGRIRHHGALTLLSPADGRVMFILPSGQRTIIGTTDTFTASDPDHVRANWADIDYLLSAANYFFPSARLDRADVVSAWAGIRPLAATDAGDSVSASREHVISTSPAGVTTITGGKLTTFRIMARQTVDRALEQARRPVPPSITDVTPLFGHDPDTGDEWAELRQRVGRRTAKHLRDRYGWAWPVVCRTLLDTPGGTDSIDGLHYYWGELRYACEAQQARTLGDLMIRRTHLAFERRDHGKGIAAAVAEFVAPFLGWSAEGRAREIHRYQDEVDSIFGIDP